MMWAPGAIFAAMCLISSFFIAFLPETTGLNLPTTVEELDDWYKQNKGWNIKLKRTNDKNSYI